MEAAWVMLIVFAFYNADQKPGIEDIVTMKFNMPSKEICEQRVQAFDEVKFSFGDRAFTSSVSCINVNIEEEEI